MTTPRRVPGSRWSSKQYILAALLGMLATAAVVAAISISLAPAHIAFSVQDASITHKNRTNKHGTFHYWYYNLTLAANNTSHHRTEVSYGSLTVDIWRSETAWIPTEEVDTSHLPRWLPPGDTHLFMVGVEGGQFNEAPPPPPSPSPPPPPQGPSSNVAMGNSSCVAKWPNYRVVVEAKVRFRFARVPSLPYTVTASIFPVNFVDREITRTSSLANCIS